jgi:hypothetical protein
MERADAGVGLAVGAGGPHATIQPTSAIRMAARLAIRRARRKDRGGTGRSNRVASAVGSCDTRAAVKLRLSLIFVLAGACAKPSQMPARTLPNPPAPDLYHLCSDVRFQSMCTPVPDQQPVRVDTNLAYPRPVTASAG